MDMLMGGIFTRSLTMVKGLFARWGDKSEQSKKVVQMDSWLEHKMEKLWEQEENQILHHYEMLSQED